MAYDFSKQGKKATIPEQMLFDMVSLLLNTEVSDYLKDAQPQRYEDFWNGIQTYIDNKAVRGLYSKSKCAPTEEEREKARQEYLDLKGIPRSFRW